MTRYLLGTNIISNATKPRPSEALLAWMVEQRDADLCISTLSLAEIRRGILQKDEGRKRRDLEAWYVGPDGPPALFHGRILGFDEPAAVAWAEIMADGARRGAPRSAMDMLVAAIARVGGCTAVTDNERHFRGVVEVLNPMRSPSEGDAERS
ncbi:MAG TPA: type II toxin-antitoxin system VapC family toxin [Caulobacteraceae bacterium]|nr:type II toxin-antitoxin system VapC family toxin [Caulobacteraceae bacterium]